MSAFVVVYKTSNTPVEPGILERAMLKLNHRGPDGRDSFFGTHYAMGHWHFWTTPEEVGEKQPLELPCFPFTIVMDGRLDNRPELIHNLKINPLDGNHFSDAALVLYAYDHWGEHCFEHFIGEFALVLLDRNKELLICARDPLGDRTLFFSFKGNLLVVASEPWAVANADGIPPSINESAVAYYFALKAPEDWENSI